MIEERRKEKDDEKMQKKKKKGDIITLQAKKRFIRYTITQFLGHNI